MAHELVVHCKRAAHDVYIGREPRAPRLSSGRMT